MEYTPKAGVPQQFSCILLMITYILPIVIWFWITYLYHKQFPKTRFESMFDV